jgi:hypothetical protein
MALTAERAVLLGQRPVVLIVLLELDVHALVEAHVHEMDRRPPFSDHLQIGPVLGIVKPPQLAVVNAETVVPDVQDALLDWAIACRGRNGAAAGIGNLTALDAVAAKCVAGAAETRSR